MLKMKKKATTTLFVLATSCFAAGFAMLGFQATDVAKADMLTEDIYMKASASVRVDDPIGIRFSTYVSEDYASSGKSFGTFVIPETAYTGDIEDIDQNTPNVLDIPQVVWADSDLDGYKKYTAVLIGIPESFYGVDIYAMSYAKDGDNYEFVSNPQSYSVAYIASAALNNGESAEALYTYTNAVAEGVTVDTASATLWEGEELALTATTQPAGYKAVWTSSDKSVATVDKYGVVKGVSEGTATITATFGNYTASCEVTVWPYTVSFEKGIPAGFTGTLRNTKATQSNAQASDGEYSMLLDTTSSNGYGYTCINKEYLDKVFADENVVAIAIDVYSNVTFTDFAYRGFRPSGEANIPYGKAGLTANTWKTIYYGRTAYEESANLTGTNYLFYYAPNTEGFDLYVDNMRPVMADELGINFNEGGEVNGEVYSVNGETVVTISGGVTNMKLYEGKSSDNDNKSIRYQFWRGNPGSDIILPIEQMLLGAGAYSYVAFDVMLSYDVSGALYYTNNTGTGTYDDIKANEWTTLYCPINYYNLTNMERTYIFRLPAYKLDNFFVYVDNIRFVNEKPTTYTITYDANGGSVANATTVVAPGTAYTLETPTAPDAFATFEGWYVNGKKFPATGTWTKEENITLTAKWSYALSFENGIPAGFTGTLRNTKASQSNAQASDGEYSMLLDTTSSNGYGYTCINKEYLDKVFADENVVAIAIDVYSNVTFTDFAYRGFRPSGEANISYGKAGLTANTWKTIYYGRTAYEESASLTGTNYLLYYSPDTEGFDLYVDNMRPVTADELGINFNEGGEVVNNESYQINGETVVTISGGVNNLMVYEGKSSDNDNKSIRFQFWRRNPGGDIILPIEQMLLGAGTYSYVAFDVMVSYDVSGAVYYTNNTGTGTYDDIKANEWTTLYCPINYYNLTNMDKTYIFRLPASTADNFMVYVDNIRFVNEKPAPAPVVQTTYASLGDVYVPSGAQTTLMNVGANVMNVQMDNQSVEYECLGEYIAIPNSLLTNGDHTLVITFPQNVEMRATVTVYSLIENVAATTVAYGSQGYQTFEYANVTEILVGGQQLPFEYGVGNTTVLIADATLIETLQTVDGEKKSGTVDLVVLTTGEDYLLSITVTVNGSATVLNGVSYENDYSFSSAAYSSVEYYTSKNIANLSPEKLMEYKNSGLSILHPGYDAGVSSTATALTQQTKTLLKNASKVGLKVILEDYFLIDLSKTTQSLIGSVYADTAALDGAVWARLQMYCNYDAFYGVVLEDEPTYNSLTAYGEVYQSIVRVCRANNVECYIHCNMLGIFANYSALGSSKDYSTNTQRFNAYKGYLQKFIDVTGADYVMYDLYPLTSEGLTGWWILNLQAAAEVAKENGVALQLVTQTCTIQSSFFGTDNQRVMSVEDLRWINNMALGFGAKEIHYFTYYARSDNDNEKYIDEGSFMTSTGEKTDVYYRMQAILEQNQQFASVIKSFNYVSANLIKGSKVSYNNTGLINSTDSKREYSRAEEFDTDSFSGALKKVSADKEYVLLTTLSDGVNDMYMVQNAVDPQYDVLQTVTLTFTGKTYAIVYENGFKRVVNLTSNGELVLQLSEGNAAFVMAF